MLLEVQDDRVGIGEDFDPVSSSSFGMKIITLLASQLKADLNWIHDEGTLIRLSFTV